MGQIKSKQIYIGAIYSFPILARDNFQYKSCRHRKRQWLNSKSNRINKMVNSLYFNELCVRLIVSYLYR